MQPASPICGPAEQQPSKRPYILLLEDSDSVRRSMQMLLQGRGFDVKAFASGLALLADPEAVLADGLIADFSLGDTNGIEVLVRLRNGAWTGPAILITGFGSAELTRRAQSAGFSEVFDKPFKDHVLVAALNRVLGRPASST